MLLYSSKGSLEKGVNFAVGICICCYSSCAISMLASAEREEPGLQFESQLQTRLFPRTRYNAAGWEISLPCLTISNWAIANTGESIL